MPLGENVVLGELLSTWGVWGKVWGCFESRAFRVLALLAELPLLALARRTIPHGEMERDGRGDRELPSSLWLPSGAVSRRPPRGEGVCEGGRCR